MGAIYKYQFSARYSTIYWHYILTINARKHTTCNTKPTKLHQNKTSKQEIQKTSNET